MVIGVVEKSISSIRSNSGCRCKGSSSNRGSINIYNSSSGGKINSNICCSICSSVSSCYSNSSD